MSKRPGRQVTVEAQWRQLQAHEMRSCGMPWAEIGERLGVTPSGAAYLARRYDFWRRHDVAEKPIIKNLVKMKVTKWKRHER